MDTWEQSPWPARVPDDVTREELAQAMGIQPEHVDDALALMGEPDRRRLKAQVKRNQRGIESLDIQWKEDCE